MKNENQTNLTEELMSIVKKKKKKNGVIIFVILLVFVVIAGLIFLIIDKSENTLYNVSNPVYESDYKMLGNSLEKFDLYFLKLKNEEENKIYSPLSIKYALAMLADGADGNSKTQIESIIGDYKAKSYINSANMSFANAIFINESYKTNIKQSYIDKLSTTYGADVIFDSFKIKDNVNEWVKNKTLKLIDGILDSNPTNERFILLNALGIDMEWEEKFIIDYVYGVHAIYSHEEFGWSAASTLSKLEFNDKKEVSSMQIVASFNNYDIVTVLGEDNIRKTVEEAYRKYIENYPELVYGFELTEEGINNEVSRYLDKYIEEIDSQYQREDKTTDFLFYTDDNIKAFAKDLKEYDGITLQYVAIMPTTEDLDIYITNTDAEKIKTVINNLKDLKLENFKDGVITKINGFIPKFKFEYKLDLKKNLKTLGITDVFDSSKANLSKLISETGTYIDDVNHKANIEFTQDGIKAAAATSGGGKGAGGPFDYYFDVPVEEIDLTFDKPYMFIIRDKNSGEVWFSGTVYNPLEWSDEEATMLPY